MRIAILDDYQNLAFKLADWTALGARAQIKVFDQPIPQEDAARQLRDFDVICLMRERMAFPASLISRLPNLKFIAITGHKHRTLDMAAAAARGILVSHTTRGPTGGYATPELAWGLIIALARHIPLEAGRMRAGGWQTTCGIALGGRTLGLVGLGRLGQYMVPIAKAFGMNVIAWSQNMTAEHAAQAGAVRVEKKELFAQSDFISLHLVLSERTRKIVGRHEFAAMKPTAYLINTARGGLIDTHALIDAISNKQIAGAGLDTFEHEPLPDNDPLRRLDNVILTPHLGYTVDELMTVFYADTMENVTAYLDGRPIRLLAAG